MDQDIHQPQSRFGCLATLYLGANIPAAALNPNRATEREEVTETEFSLFLDDSVTPKFSGFTLANVQGYWKGKPEPVRVLTILGEDSHTFRVNVRWIAEAYKSRFCQEAVAYSFSEAQFTLDCWPHGPVGAYHRDGKGY